MARQECPITTRDERKKAVRYDKEEREAQPAESLSGCETWRQLCEYVCVCVHEYATIDRGTCTMLALLILGLEQSGKYDPLSQRARDELQNSSCVATVVEPWSFHSYSLFHLNCATSNAKRWNVCVCVCDE